MTSPLKWKDFLQLAHLPLDARCLSFNNQRYALVKVTGSDAENFLHAQFSNAVTGLKADEVRFAAWCNAKGRVWTLVRYWQHGDAIILRIPADQVEDTLKRLRMFIMRSDVQLEQLDLHATQFLGQEAETQAKHAAEQLDEDTFNIPLPAAWPLREVWSPSIFTNDLNQFPEELEPLPRILAGIPEVFAAQREEWIPQMLNLDKLNGIDFQKGCYPGQEIVAKLHYKGGLKKRMFLGSVENSLESPKPKMDVIDPEDKIVGSVIEASGIGGRYWLNTIIRLETTHELLSITSQGKPRLFLNM